MKMLKAWPEVPEASTEKEKIGVLILDQHSDTKDSESKGAKVWPKTLVESTVNKTLKELLNQSFEHDSFEHNLESDVEVHKEQTISLEDRKKKEKKKNAKFVPDLKKKVEARVFAFEDSISEEPKNIRLKENAEQKRNFIASESIKYIWIALGSFCLLAFLFLNSILSKLKNLENLISRQTKVLTN